MKYLFCVFLLGLFIFPSSCGDDKDSSDRPPPAPAPPPTPVPVPPPVDDKLSYSKDAAPIIEKSCSPCHFGGSPKAKFSLDSETALRSNLAKALNKVNKGEMPPADSGKPTISNSDRLKLVNWYNNK